jgi:hypothetical protein
MAKGKSAGDIQRDPGTSIDLRTDKWLSRQNFGLDKIVEDFGGLGAFLDVARLSDNVGVQEFVRLSHRFPESGAGELCARAGLEPPELLSHLVQVMFFYGQSVAKMLNAVNQPAVMKASVAQALTAHGVEDRKLQFEIAGLAGKKAPLVSVNIGNKGISEKFIQEADGDFEVIDVQPDLEPETDNGGGEKS